MAAPRYFQTEDEKRMAAIRANPSGRPMQMVRPMRPASSDSREKWRENAGGKMIGMDQYLENNRKMYTMENVPNAERQYSPTGAGPSGMEPDLPMRSMNLNAAKPNYDPLLMTPAEIEEKEKAEREQESYRIEQKYGSDKGGSGILKRDRSYRGLPELPPDQAEMSGIYTPSNAPGSYTGPGAQSNNSRWQQDLTKKYPELGVKGSTANQYFTTGYKPTMSKVEVDELAERSVGDYSSSPKPDNIRQLTPLIPKGTRWGTSLDDLPDGRRTPQPFSRPMGMGTLSEKARPTAPGASERLAARRAVLRDPKSTAADRRWARKIGGASNNQSSNWAP